MDIKLNKEQLEAVKHGEGPILIIAGAGTGKTTVISERIKYLITSRNVKASSILALTFTDKAAREMEERIDVAMPYGYTEMWIYTFHSFCDRVLRENVLHIGLDPKYRLMSQADAIRLIRDNLFEFKLKYFRPLGNPNKFVEGMISHFSRLQDEDIGTSEYVAWANDQFSNSNFQKENKLEIEKWMELASAYRKYEEIKVRNGFFDFGDLIAKTLSLFRKRPNVLREYQRRFEYILVDEFQDTNYAQNELAIMLAGKKANIAATGDDDQSIYRFRGAAVSNIIQFRKTYPKAKIVVLTKNYRSTQEILDRAYDLIRNNNPDRLEVVEDIDKELVSVRTGPTSREAKRDGVTFIHADRVENEADLVARQVKDLVSKGDYEFSDVAILVRANAHAEPFVRALSRHGVPNQFLGPGRLFRQPEIIDLISYLKVLRDFDDSVSFSRLLAIPEFGIPGRDLVRIGNFARRYNLTLFEALERIDEIFLEEKSKGVIKKILGIIEKHLKLVRKETAGQLVYFFLEEMQLLPKLLNPKDRNSEKKAANISKFFDKLRTYEVDHEDATVGAVADWIELSSELGESPLAADLDWTELNAVNILTVHSAKGLEFKIVFLVNLVGQRFPTIERREQIPIPEELIKEVLPRGDYHLEEERRLFYVGMTRARDLLFFTGANYYGEGKREKKLSPFVFEALGEGAVASEQKLENITQLSFLDYKKEAPLLPTKSGFVGQGLHVDYLSYSQIETFRTCPLHYKLKYILKVPAPPSSAQSMGSSIHLALSDFYMAIKTGKRATRELMLRSLEESWISLGFSSKKHESLAFERAKGFLLRYYKKEFDVKKIPVVIEQPFVIPLSPLLKKERPLKIGGKIDRVDELPHGKVEIIDYKTGANVPTQKEVDHDLQLTFYAMAASLLPESPYNRKPESIILTLYYFDNETKISTVRTKEELESAREEIYKVRKEIEESDFKCSKNMLCERCEYSVFCRSEE